MHKGPAMASDISNNIASWSTTDASNQPDNTDVLGPNILAENLRAIQSAIRADSAASNSIASASTTDLSTLREGVITVTGVTTITAFGTVAAGVKKWLVFASALTLTHNGTSLILPGAANISTAAGDACCMLSLGSGNWRCVAYTKADGSAVSTSTVLADGTVGTPAIRFASDTDCGLYRIGANNIGLSVNGGKVVDIATTGQSITGALSASTTVTAGTNFIATAGYAAVDKASGYVFNGATTSGMLYQQTSAFPTRGTSGLQFKNGGTASFEVFADGFVSLRGEIRQSANDYAIIAVAESASQTQDILALPTASSGTGFNFVKCTSSYSGAADVEFKVRGDGTVYSDGGTAMTTPADYAEMFEWLDGNPNNEDRVGLSVALVGTKIKVAGATDTPIGIISGNPAVLADSGATRWVDKFLRDDFNRPVFDADGKRVLNPAFDPDQPYTPREQRPEWSPVGLVGKLRMRKGQITGAGWIKMRDISESVEEWLVK